MDINSRLTYSSSVLILLFSNGLSNGWNSPSFPVLLSESKSPLPSGPLTVDEVSWIVSSVSIGCLFGGLLIGWLMEALGRKVAGCIISFIQIVRTFTTLDCTSGLTFALLFN